MRPAEGMQGCLDPTARKNSAMRHYLQSSRSAVDVHSTEKVIKMEIAPVCPNTRSNKLLKKFRWNVILRDLHLNVSGELFGFLTVLSMELKPNIMTF
jgi:hypothetical protein